MPNTNDLLIHIMSIVNILDRYLTVVKPETIHREKLQCVGMCALMIAG